jgi:thiol:disulfide interchange protein DsbD
MEYLTETFELALSGSPLVAFALVYLAGLATSLTPCVLPMLPMAVGIITASARKREFVDGKVVDTVISRSRALMMGLSYALGLSLMFTLLGLLAALSGKAIFGMLAASPYTYATLSVLMLLLAIWLLWGERLSPEGAMLNYANEIDPRTGSYLHKGKFARVLRWYTQTQGGGALITFAFGFLSGIIAGPCTAPVIAAVLAYVAKVGTIGYGVALMFVYAMGLATLMVVAGVSATLSFKISKKSVIGQYVKYAFSVIMFGMMLYFGYQAAAVAGWIGGDYSDSAAPMYRITWADGAGLKAPDVYQIGSIFPDFTYEVFAPTAAEKTDLHPADSAEIKDESEKPIVAVKRFSQHRGKVVFITFWGSWCKACLEEVPHINELKNRYADNPDFIILSVEVQDGLESAPGFIARFGITYPVLIDDQGKLSEDRLELSTYPYNIIIDRNGKIGMAEGYLPKDIGARIDTQLGVK